MCMVALLPLAKTLCLPWCSAGRLVSLLDAVRINLSMILFKFAHQCEGEFVVILVGLLHLFFKVKMQMTLSQAAFKRNENL